MYSKLTPQALNEITELLRHSRRALGDIFRLYSHGLSPREIAEEKGDQNPKRVEESLAALLVLFGRKELAPRGQGRQKVLNEAEHWLNSNLTISKEVEDHLNRLLYIGKRTNQRKTYVPEPVLRRELAKRRAAGFNGAQAGIYILTRADYLNDFELGKSKKLLMKIGYSASVWERITGAQTWDPEPLEILRVFLTEEPRLLETKFHVVLDTLEQNYKQGGGTEWFATDLKLIDAIGDSLGLRDCSSDTVPHDG